MGTRRSFSDMDFIIERLVTLPEELVNLPFYPVDPRVQGWFGLDWAFVLGVTTAYLVGVGILMGIMKTQSSPFSLYAYRIAHNFVMCAVSFYMFAEIMRPASPRASSRNSTGPPTLFPW